MPEYTEVALLPNAEGKEKSKAVRNNDDIKIPTRTTLLGDESSDGLYYLLITETYLFYCWLYIYMSDKSPCNFELHTRHV